MKRLAELILYVAAKSQDDTNFGATKLNKILFAIDFYSYGVFGKPITEVTYIRQAHGPTPKPSAFLPVCEALVDTGRATFQTRAHFGKQQKRLVALEEADMSLFSETERGLIDDVIQELEHFNASQLSDWTHNLVPWLATDDREEIPFYTIFVWKDRPVGQAAISWGEQRLKELRESGYVP